MDTNRAEHAKFGNDLHHFRRSNRQNQCYCESKSILLIIVILFSIQFNFDHYLRHLYILANITLIDTDWITINEPEFFRHMSELISQQSPRTIQNYLIWRFLMNHAKNMPKKYRDIKQIFVQAFQGIITEPLRNTTCAIYVNDNMGLAVSKLYIRKYFDADARNQVNERFCWILWFVIDGIVLGNDRVYSRDFH